MSRRHYKERTYIEWLKSLGCVFYAPMNQEHGLRDIVSGVTGVVPSANTHCSVSWDSALQMYVIDNQGPYYAGVWWDNLNMFPDAVDGSTLARYIPKTVLCTFRFVTNPSSNYYNIGIGLGAADNGETSNVSIGASRQVAEYTSPYISFNLRQGTTAKIGFVRNGNSFYLIKDGNWYSKNDNDLFAQTYYSHFGTRVILGAMAVNNGLRTHCAVKNVYVFNTALDLHTIREIQG